MQNNKNIKLDKILTDELICLENILNSDILLYYGEFIDGVEKVVKDVIEDIDNKKDTLSVILTTNGGSITPVERIVNIFRHHYKEVNFIIPDHAYSAGTILSMSGDNIYMDYYSVLGPIDPQVKNKNNKFVPALGYLDKINEMIEKAKTGNLSDPEFIILKEFDLAELRKYEQAKNLTIDILKKWLTKYKFKNWSKHSNGKDVTNDEREERAKSIAEQLSDNNLWKTHDRAINKEILENDLKLKIEGIDKNEQLKNALSLYYNHFLEYKKIYSKSFLFIHYRNNFIIY
ncbi:hypothetical protein R4Q14_04830 [Brachyspira intermedia]|uniref:SDH family Clp fold serine proteinase n=1 Tax=Brachyspira intermedia TaxID=84377 RepID=UPI003007303A